MQGVPWTSNSEAEISDASFLLDLVTQESSLVQPTPSVITCFAKALTRGISSGWMADIGKDRSSSRAYPSMSQAFALTSMIVSRSASTTKIPSLE